MAYNRPFNSQDIVISAFNPSGASASGSRITIASPIRGQLMEVGFTPNSVITSATTLTVLQNLADAAPASSFVTVVTSTLGSFSSAVLFEGAVASVIPPSATFLRAGDALQFVTSGGQTSTVGVTVYAVIRRN